MRRERSTTDGSRSDGSSVSGQQRQTPLRWRGATRGQSPRPTRRERRTTAREAAAQWEARARTGDEPKIVTCPTPETLRARRGRRRNGSTGRRAGERVAPQWVGRLAAHNRVYQGIQHVDDAQSWPAPLRASPVGACIIMAGLRSFFTKSLSSPRSAGARCLIHSGALLRGAVDPAQAHPRATC